MSNSTPSIIHIWPPASFLATSLCLCVLQPQINSTTGTDPFQTHSTLFNSYFFLLLFDFFFCSTVLFDSISIQPAKEKVHVSALEMVVGLEFLQLCSPGCRCLHDWKHGYLHFVLQINIKYRRWTFLIASYMVIYSFSSSCQLPCTLLLFSSQCTTETKPLFCTSPLNNVSSVTFEYMHSYWDFKTIA